MCHERAAEAARKADAISDPTLKADYLAAADRWMTLARSYELTDRIADFTAAMSDSRNQRDKVAQADALLLQEISTSLIREGDIGALYERILDGAVSLMAADMGSMQVFESDRNEMRLLAWRGFHPESAAFWDRINPDSAHTSCGVALLSGRRIIVPDAELCDFMAGSADLEHYRLSNIRAVQSTPLVARSGQLLGMISTHWREAHQPPERALQLLDVLARQAADLIERAQREEQLRLFASIVESSDDAIVSHDLDGIITSWNKGAERIFGFTAEEAAGMPHATLIPPDRRDEDAGTIERIRRGQRIELHETVRMRKHGSKVEVALTVSPIRNAAGKIVGVSTIARDITERKRAEGKIAVLAHEAEHRVKNVLATVQATVHLTRADTAEDYKRAIEGRIQALANVHRLFVESRWAGADMRTLVSEQLAAYSLDRETRIRISGAMCVLEPNAAQAVAVALHELATNAAKYGALSVPAGCVRVEWSCEGNRPVVLRWIETDGPAVEAPKRQGFGTRIMDNMIRKQLKGRLHVDWRREGLVCEIILPPQ